MKMCLSAASMPLEIAFSITDIGITSSDCSGSGSTVDDCSRCGCISIGSSSCYGISGTSVLTTSSTYICYRYQTRPACCSTSPLDPFDCIKGWSVGWFLRCFGLLLSAHGGVVCVHIHSCILLPTVSRKPLLHVSQFSLFFCLQGFYF